MTSRGDLFQERSKGKDVRMANIIAAKVRFRRSGGAATGADAQCVASANSHLFCPCISSWLNANYTLSMAPTHHHTTGSRQCRTNVFGSAGNGQIDATGQRRGIN
jgi:hypothetical protein